MKNSANHFTKKILDFMSVIYDCRESTTYANDRAINSYDLVVAMRWIVKLRKGINWALIWRQQALEF